MQGLRNKKTDIRNATGRQAASEATCEARRLEYGGVSCTNEWTTKLSARQSKDAWSVGEVFCTNVVKQPNISGGDTVWGNTRSHPEHDGEDHIGRRYCIGDDTGE